MKIDREFAALIERQRVDHLVMGMPRNPLPEHEPDGKPGRRRSTKRKAKHPTKPIVLVPGIEEAVQLRERWAGKAGTPETLEHASRTHQGSLAQLHANGTIDNEELEWAAQIANVHRSIESEVAIAIASLEARVDNGGRGAPVSEGVLRVRLHLAYTFWRQALPMPKRLVLDMVVGDTIGFTVAARRYGVHNRKAKRMLLDAIRRWPACVDRAFRVADAETVRAMNEARR